MKRTPSFIAALLALSLFISDAEARGIATGRGEGRRAGGGEARRSPATASKIQRPAAQPARPAARPAPQPTRPAARPAPQPSRPEARPAPAPRPSVRPSTRPAPGPSTRPAPGITRPEAGRPELPRPSRPERPDPGRPGPNAERPGINRPQTLPGIVGYPDRPGPSRPGRPNIGNQGNQINVNRPGDRTHIGRIGDREINIGEINVRGRNNVILRPSNLPKRQPDWNTNRWGGNRGIWGNRVNIGNDINIKIDRHFHQNNNFSWRPDYWGARPWWGAGQYHGWHHGHWHHGWNHSYYHRCWWFHDDDDFARGFMWGIGVWSLGNLIYQMGYQSYHNPYPAPPVQNTYITYTQPVSVAAAANPPGDETAAATAEEKSAAAFETSRAAFKNGDYPAALKFADEALAHTPDDISLHEYRALVFFALGKYADAAGVLNAVLASGPGWGWDTMIGFYNGSSAYNDQLKKLEDYARNSGKADSRFLLGYHYMICGHLEDAHGQFAKAAELEPADSISRQLSELTADSIPDGGETDAEPPARPDLVPLEKLTGTWSADNAGGKITFDVKESGDFTWTFAGGGETSEVKGTYGLDDKGLLVLTTGDSQMISAIELDGNGALHFVLVGAPDGEPGIAFTKS